LSIAAGIPRAKACSVAEIEGISTIAPDNATGNFTEIVQWLPIKILVTPRQPLAKLLRVSVETAIDTELEEGVNEQRKSSDRLTGR
jgi:membrane fusion protein (multidrug efflux system)